MSIKRTFIATIAALALVATIAPVQANAATVEELMAQLTALQAQLAALQGTSGSTGTSSYSACAGVTFSRYLTVGSTGSDVKCLQQVLNGTGYRVATTGAGSPGNETSYFGSLTLAAARAWQTAQGWVAANQIGPKSIALLNSIVAGSSTGSTGSTGGTVTGDGLLVKVSSDTPDAGEIVAGQAQAELAKFTFTNKDSSAVKVTKLKLQRKGISSDTDVTNVYLFKGAVRLTDAASVSSGVISFNDSTGLFTIPAGSSVTITVAADIYSSADGNVYVAINSDSDITTNASAVSGNFPLRGETQSISTGASLATADFKDTGSGSTGTVLPNSSTIDPQADYSVWNTNVAVSISSGKVKLTRLALREVGSVDYTDVENFRLYVDGVQVGDAVANLDSNGYVTFDLTDDPALLKSGTRALKVLADVVGGSGKTFSFQLKTTADVTLVDSQYGVAITPTSDAATFTAMRSCYDGSSTYACTVGSGAVTTTKASDSPSGDIVNESSNVVLAKWKMKANGERVKVESLKAYAALTGGNTTTSTLRNAAIYADDVQIGSTFSLSMTSATPSEVNLGSSLILEPNESVVIELRADIYDNTGTNDLITGQTITGYLVLGASNGQGLSSSNSVNVPTSTVSGNALTIATGSLTLSKYTAYTNRTTTAPQTDYKLAHFTLTGSTTEATNVHTLRVDLDSTLADAASNLYVKMGSYTTTAKANPSTTNSWSVNYTLAKGTTVDVMVYADADSTMTDTGAASVLISGTTADSGTSVSTNSGSVLAGQTITFGTGRSTATLDSTTPEAAVVAGGQLVTAAKFKFTASNDSYTITEAKVKVNGNNGAVIQYATLSDGTNTYTSAYDSTNNYFNFTGMSISAPEGSTSLTASLMLATPSTDGTTITTGKDVKLTLYYVKALNSQGVVKEGYEDASDSGVTMTASALTGNSLYVYKSVPTFTQVAVTGEGTNLSSSSTTTLYAFTVKADTMGDVALKQLKFVTSVSDINTSSYGSLSNFKFFRGSSDITSSVTIQTTAGVSLEDSTTIGSGTVVVTFNTEEGIGAGATNTYYLKATPAGFSTSSSGSDTVSTYLAGDTTATSQASNYYYLVGKTTATSETQVQYLTTSANITSAGSGSTYNVIWSDNSASGTNSATSAIGHVYDAGASSADWFNGYYIKNLPLSSTGIAAQ